MELAKGKIELKSGALSSDFLFSLHCHWFCTFKAGIMHSIDKLVGLYVFESISERHACGKEWRTSETRLETFIELQIDGRLMHNFLCHWF